jgi:hypothetical protein
MAVKTKAEILESIRDHVGDSTDDKTLEFLEDVTDTLTDLEARASDSTDWKGKYNELDKSWREKYRERFFSSDPKESTTDNDNEEFEEKEDKEKKTYESLFDVKE